MQPYLRSSKQQVFLPSKCPLVSYCPFLLLLFFVMLIHCQADFHPNLQVPAALQLRDASSRPEPDYTWSKSHFSTIWLCFRAWMRSTSLLLQCSSETTNWKDFLSVCSVWCSNCHFPQVDLHHWSGTTVFNYLQWIRLSGNMVHIKWIPALRYILVFL